MVNCVACYVGIILSGLQYRFSSFRDGDVEIDHDNGDLWLKCWSEHLYVAHDVEIYLEALVYHKYKTDTHIHIDMFNITAKGDGMCRRVLN